MELGCVACHIEPQEEGHTLGKLGTELKGDLITWSNHPILGLPAFTF